MDRSRAVSSWGGWHRRLAIRRRLVAAALAGVAVVSGLSAARPTPPPTRAVWVAARDLAGGEPLVRGDVRLESMPVADVPSDALPAAASVTGRLLAAPVRAGEPLTDVRILSPALLAAADLADAVAVPVRVADGAAALALVHAGDLVDVIAAPQPGSGEAPESFVVVHDVRVLAVPPHDDGAGDAGSGDGGGLLIVAVTERQAAALARAATGDALSIAVRRGA